MRPDLTWAYFHMPHYFNFHSAWGLCGRVRGPGVYDIFVLFWYLFCVSVVFHELLLFYRFTCCVCLLVISFLFVVLLVRFSACLLRFSVPPLICFSAVLLSLTLNPLCWRFRFMLSFD